ncbi:MAG: DUF4157 domain-containing protein [Chloroflexi bacterium]|nr:MAG: DUF4157 domain-containing protein [Chloroflexota bacterium]
MSIQNKRPKGQKGKQKRGISKPIQGNTPQPERPSSPLVTQPTPNDDLQRTIEEVAGLQQTIGNQAVGRLLIQTKLTLGPVGDKYEQEADAVAKEVVSQPITQRQEEEELQMKPVTAVQRQDEEELQMMPLVQRQDEEELQMKSVLQRQDEEELQLKPVEVRRQSETDADGSLISADIDQSIQRARGSGQPLDVGVRSPMENAFGANFSGVKIHTDSQSDTLNRSLQARAFTTGQDIFFRQGEYKPASSSGQELIAHELTHVMQQQGASIQRSQITSVPSIKIQRALNFDDAKKAILSAGEGWGTDESGIYDAIRDCSDRPRLKADPAVQKLLKGELSGHDYWKALLLLEYGNESSFPDAVKEIWSATKGIGTDEDKIYEALQKLSAADVALIKKVPGIQDILSGDLSGSDKKAVDNLLDGKYAQAIQNHKTNVATTQQILNNMKAPAKPVRVRNTAEWLDPSTAGASPKNDLYVLTPTHDSSDRAKKHDQKNKVAYFGDTPKFPDNSADYDAHIDSERNIHYSAATVAGEHLGKKIWVHDPQNRSVTTVEQILVHEVQHDADRHDEEPGHDEDYKSPEESWNRYKTEFRAYWVDGQLSGLSASSGTATKPEFDNRRQESIFDHMYNSTVYGVWLKPNYDDNTEVYGDKFKDLVHAYIKPEGVNLINSPRIDDFFRKLENCTKSNTDLTASPLKELETAANTLDADDRNYINTTDALRLQEMAKDHLSDTVLAHIATIVNGGTLPGWANVNISEAREAIKKAGEGWGTDEGAIYDAIANTTPAERAAMKQDPTIRQVLHEELSGHDLWKAQLMLEFGAENQWPQSIKAIWEATKGAGTDEKQIRSALEKLTRPQVEAIARVEGLQDMMKDELSGLDKKTVDELLKGEYADAIKNHQQDMTAISTIIQAGLTDPDANKQKIFNNLNNPSKSLIHAMTKTHNSAERVQEENKTGTDAFFGADTAYPAANGNYDSMQTANNGIRFTVVGTPSETEGINLYIYEARNMSGPDLRAILEQFGQTLP